MFFIDGKPLDLTTQQPGVSIQLKPGGSITQSQNGVTQSVVNNTTQLKPLHELVKTESK